MLLCSNKFINTMNFLMTFNSQKYLRHIQSLVELFVYHNAHIKLEIHLIHDHFKTFFNIVILKISIENSCNCWIKATTIDAVNLSKIHEHIFVLHSSDKFVAYKYQDDSMLDFFIIKKVFFIKFILYLIRNNLLFLLEL